LRRRKVVMLDGYKEREFDRCPHIAMSYFRLGKKMDTQQHIFSIWTKSDYIWTGK